MNTANESELSKRFPCRRFLKNYLNLKKFFQGGQRNIFFQFSQPILSVRVSNIGSMVSKNI